MPHPAHWLIALANVDFVTFYADKLRPSLFSGFLTLTGFLFAVKTFIIINLRKEVYEHAEYHKRVEEMRAVDPKLSVYGPLRRLSRMLTFSVALALGTSLAQFSVGLIASPAAAIACLSLAALTIIVVAIDLTLLAMNLRTWFDFLEKQAKLAKK